MKIGSKIKCRRFGDEGKVIRKLSLEELAIENGEEITDPDEFEEWDLPYVIAERKDGTTFAVCEYEADEIPKRKRNKNVR